MTIMQDDIKKFREKVSDNMYQISKLMIEILSLEEKLEVEYDLSEYGYFFNEYLPLKEYPFDKSFDEVLGEIQNWIEAIDELIKD